MNTEHSTFIDHAAVAHANELVTQTGILHTLDRWRAEDNITKRGGLVPERAVLVGLLLLARCRASRCLTMAASSSLTMPGCEKAPPVDSGGALIVMVTW